uniref:OppC_N domain-containing protein n=1 Tax=Heterorhabditis bacteriophora TaxID=37862 RepID=A0A1I7WTC2_HETBA
MEIVAQLAIGRLRQYERHRNRAILGAAITLFLSFIFYVFDFLVSSREGRIWSFGGNTTIRPLNERLILRKWYIFVRTTVDSQVLMVVFDPIFYEKRRRWKRSTAFQGQLHCLPLGQNFSLEGRG